jgi:hypothetical protein
VKGAFIGSFRGIDDTELPAESRPIPGDYEAWVRTTLASLRPRDEGIVRFVRPRPTAAFSPQDTLHPHYKSVQNQMLEYGFAPVERSTGGRLAIFDENALVISILAAHPDPREHIIERYQIFANILANTLMLFGIDARIGELPYEYCPGRFSLNASGRLKLAGMAQRISRTSFQIEALICVTRSPPACTALAAAYAGLELQFDPHTYGALTDVQPTLDYGQVKTTFKDAVTAALSG